MMKDENTKANGSCCKCGEQSYRDSYGTLTFVCGCGWREVKQIQRSTLMSRLANPNGKV